MKKEKKVKPESSDEISNEAKEITSKDEVIESSREKEEKEETKETTNKNEKEAPAEKATKVFGNIAAYNWWSKMGLFNILLTVGIVFVFLAFFWTSGISNDKYIANMIFAWVLVGLGLVLNVVMNALFYSKRIKCFRQEFKIWSSILSFIPLGFIGLFVFSSMESKEFYEDEKVKKMGYVRPKKTMPHVYVTLMIIIFVVIVASWLVTWTNGSSSLAPAGFLYVLVAPIQGFVDAAELIIFLMIMGGFLAIVTESQALEAGLGRMVKKMHGKEIIMVPILFVLFSVGGTTYGMAEETIPFYLLLIPVFLAAGFDAYTAFLTILLGAGLGTASSILNPFVVNTAISGIKPIADSGSSAMAAADGTSGVNDAIAKLSPSIGIIWRSVIYVVLVIAGASYVTWYAWRVKKHPEKSAVYHLKAEHEKEFAFDIDSLPEFTLKRKLILSTFGLTFLFMIISVITWQDVAKTQIFIDAANWIDKYFPFIGGTKTDGSSLIGAFGTWYLIQMSFLFFLSSLIIGALSWRGSVHFINKFLAGSADFIGVSIVISIARGISVVVKDTGLSELIINGLQGMLNGIGNAFAVVFIFYFIFIILSFLIPSTSGFAAAVFPVLGPAVIGSYNLGLTVSGQIASFSMASGLVNIASPSGGIFIAALSVSKIPLGNYYKTTGWFLGVFMVLSIALLLIGQAVNGTGFSSASDALNGIF
ncbi:YfcC family protein [Malacoplasma iowae]|uniref:YfcC family protein n=1 Tax=Malacoplasma iowae 695 TaxID=1048830 RepID=A0A6P1LML3_MALIO|nr:YfcC family protein [Malacoplasma iowae]VEU62428.1 membrane arginine transporter [Mycoplasmopsis fermentans]EGZ31054.1 arginine-ornithine APC transporter [Malacoplasma iowae 695]QHG89762.1 YfcC family protein [Malacoplasma iowae 695]WPL35439.1 YfcC family protein [Malacoplasma iowae]VEU72306.1 membrane arginine transporter [Malacoplasma iowae]